MWKSRYKSIQKYVELQYNKSKFGNKHVIDVQNYYRRRKEKVRENAKNFLKGECCCQRRSKYWDVIYGYKYWRSLEPGKRIVEFAGSRSSEGTSVFCFLFTISLAFATSPPPPDRVPTVSQTCVLFVERTDLHVCTLHEKPFYRISLGKNLDMTKERRWWLNSHSWYSVSAW